MRIAIVNDMSLAVEALCRVVALAPEHEIAWVAVSGEEAIQRCKTDLPDLILMDLIMPGMGGVEATHHIMEQTPCAILIVTASVDDNIAKTFAAMGHGALDAVDLPQLGREGASVEPLLSKIKSLSRLVDGNRSQSMRATTFERPPLIAIGASAGGPAALSTILLGLPPDFPAPILIVQHVDARFAAGMAEWLNGHSNLPVGLAQEGDRLKPGKVLLAGTSDHLVVTPDGRVHYTAEPKDEIYRPSINVLFQSICALWKGRMIGVLLTGMGTDGALGLKALRDRGFHTITQDSTSSAVFGMPKAAAAMAAAVDILPLKQIAPTLISLTHNRESFQDGCYDAII